MIKILEIIAMFLEGFFRKEKYRHKGMSSSDLLSYGKYVQLHNHNFHFRMTIMIERKSK